jgi:hypothetical protein
VTTPISKPSSTLQAQSLVLCCHRLNILARWVVK